MAPLRILYLDMNAFFASVEQHLDQNLRGRPVAITAVDVNSGSCVAASYEAKAHGIRTGTPVRKAKQLCPDLVLLPSRHRLYVRYNLAIAAVLDRHAELERIRSVDEFQLRLSGDAQTVTGAYALVRKLKQAVANEVGACLRFSAGAGPNHLLAKIAGKLDKPDGCRHLLPDIMPDALAHMTLDDLPGISGSMKDRLYRAGVYDVEALYRLDPRHARLIWRGVEGERFVRALQGEDIPLLETQRHGYGNSKVLAPEARHPREAYFVGRWLIEKSTARLRRDGRVAGRISLMIGVVDGPGWSDSLKCQPSQDTAYFLRLHRQLWGRFRRGRGLPQIMTVGVHLGDVAMLAERPGDLFAPLAPAQRTDGEQLAAVIDQINHRYGSGAIRYGRTRPHPGFFERG